jgi:hypothetical protein
MEQKNHPQSSNQSLTPDQQLDDLLNQWTVPPTSPWFKQRVVNAIATRRKPAAAWPWTPRWLAAAMSVATIIGVLGGALLPASAANTDSTEMISLLW